ncbi:MAG TPA: DUF6680 family protein, partial [Opitutaceae bacterium]|nr:DUF6680 family protein [Opitutaceae bacterium]
MTISDTFLILATLVSPFLAVYAQKQIENWRSHRAIQLGIFKSLMATRGAPTRGGQVSPAHAQALNMIDMEFSDTKKNERVVRQIWKEYLNNLSLLPTDPEAQKAALPLWTERNQDYLAKLLVEMGKCLKYEFDPVYIKNSVYIPQGHINDENELRKLRALTLELLSGKNSLRMQTS